MLEGDSPIFRQLAERIEGDILTGTYAEESQIPSTNEFAAFLRINPATANKAINLLVADGTLYKRRGIGMFVAPGARERLLAQRRQRFTDEYVRPLLSEASNLGITPHELVSLITRAADDTAATTSAWEGTP